MPRRLRTPASTARMPAVPRAASRPTPPEAPATAPPTSRARKCTWPTGTASRRASTSPRWRQRERRTPRRPGQHLRVEREVQRVERTGAPAAQHVVVSPAGGIPRFAARKRAPSVHIGTHLHHHAPARTGTPRSARRTERAGSALHLDVQARQRRQLQQVIDVRVLHLAPAPVVVARLAVAALRVA